MCSLIKIYRIRGKELKKLKKATSPCTTGMCGKWYTFIPLAMYLIPLLSFLNLFVIKITLCPRSIKHCASWYVWVSTPPNFGKAKSVQIKMLYLPLCLLELVWLDEEYYETWSLYYIYSYSLRWNCIWDFSYWSKSESSVDPRPCLMSWFFQNSETFS